MPYSKAQLRWAFATHQSFAERWAKQAATSGFEKPEHSIRGRVRRVRRKKAKRHGS